MITNTQKTENAMVDLIETSEAMRSALRLIRFSEWPVKGILSPEQLDRLLASADSAIRQAHKEFN